MREATYHGEVGALCCGLPGAPPVEYEVCFYYRNYYGSVDCYMWRPSHLPGTYIHFDVMDISDPKDWYRGARYEFVALVEGQPMSGRQRRLGLRRFYRVMRRV